MSNKSKKSKDSKDGGSTKRNWGSQADVDVDGDSYRITLREARQKCNGMTPSIGWIFNFDSPKWERKTVPEDWVEDAGEIDLVQAVMYSSKVTQTARDQDYALKWNKRIRESVDAGIVVFQDMFESTSSASDIIATAITSKRQAKNQWFAVLGALEKNFAPTSAADAMKYKGQIKDLKDTGRKFSDYFMSLKKLRDILKEMKQSIPKLEMEAIVLKNVMNPEFRPLKVQLTLQMGQTGVRTYDYLRFLTECRTLANASTSVDDWGLDKNDDGEPIKKALSAAKTDGGGKRSGESGGKRTGKRQVICWKCGGKHFKHECKANVCEKCKAKLSASVDHDAQTCCGETVKESKRDSKEGGAKESKKSDSSPKKGSWDKDYEKNKNKSTFLPRPSAIPTSQKRAYANAILDSLNNGDSEDEKPRKKGKKSRSKDWEPEESD
jgi:hypothetical protein